LHLVKPLGIEFPKNPTEELGLDYGKVGLGSLGEFEEVFRKQILGKQTIFIGLPLKGKKPLLGIRVKKRGFLLFWLQNQVLKRIFGQP